MKIFPCLLFAAALAVSCSGGGSISGSGAADGQTSEFRMMLRLWPAHHDDSLLSAQLIEALKDNDFCDEVWFCGESPATAPESFHEESAARMASMAEELRAIGVIPSLQVVAFGHGDSGAPDTTIHWGTMVGPNGEVTNSVNCPRQEAYLQAIEEAFVPYVRAFHPHSIYIDDDLRMTNHWPAPMGCYCDTCVELFNKEYGYSFDRPSLVGALIANQEDGLLRRRWVTFSQESLAGVARVISRGVHRSSPQTRIGLQHTSFQRLLLEGWDWNPMFRAMKEETGLDPVSRPGCGFYHDHEPRGMLEKGLDIARQIRRLEPGITEIAPEIEAYQHKATGKSPRSICLETMYYLAMGANQMSYAIICGNHEPMSWYSSHFFKELARWKPFAKEYSDFNSGALPSGINPYMSPNRVVRNNEPGEGPWAWMTDNSLGSVYELAAFGLPFAPEDPGSRVLMLDGEGIKGIGDEELSSLLANFGVVVDSDGWNRLESRGLVEGYLMADAPVGDPYDYDNPAINPGSGYNEALSRIRFLRRGDSRLAVVSTYIPNYNATSDYNGAYRLALTRTFDWASGGALPALIESMAQAALVPRVDSGGRLRSVALLNCSISDEESYTLRLRPGDLGHSPRFVWKKLGCKDKVLKATRDGSDYILTVPVLEGWNFGWIAVE